MTAPNTPQPGPTVVPSAAAERRRIWDDDQAGIAFYIAGELIFIALAIFAILAAR